MRKARDAMLEVPTLIDGQDFRPFLCGDREEPVYCGGSPLQIIDPLVGYF